jgi:hypothetical protein
MEITTLQIARSCWRQFLLFFQKIRIKSENAGGFTPQSVAAKALAAKDAPHNPSTGAA